MPFVDFNTLHAPPTQSFAAEWYYRGGGDLQLPDHRMTSDGVPIAVASFNGTVAPETAVQRDARIEAEIRSIFAGASVLDCGAGVQGAGYALASLGPAEKYLGLDMWFPKSAADRCAAIESTTQWAIEQVHVQRFLAQTSRRFDVVLLCGILDLIPQTEQPDLFQNLLRVTAPDGAILTLRQPDQYLDAIAERLNHDAVRDFRLQVDTFEFGFRPIRGGM